MSIQSLWIGESCWSTVVKLPSTEMEFEDIMSRFRATFGVRGVGEGRECYAV